MREIEPSSRLYCENGATFVTANLVVGVAKGDPQSTPVSFILTGSHLVTVRYADPKSVLAFAEAAKRLSNEILNEVGVLQDLTSKYRESLVSLGRMVGYLSLGAEAEKSGEYLAHLTSLGRDIASLAEQTAFVSGNISFLLDATLGPINVEQRAIIKIFSVAAVVFLPPTLVASIDGMNFHDIPELSWRFGYRYAIALMIASAILPYVYFKRKGWL